MIVVLTLGSLILFIFVVMITSLLIGHAMSWLISRVIVRVFRLRINIGVRGLWEKIFVYSAFGFGFMIILSVALSAFGLFDDNGVLLIIVAMVVVELSVSVTEKAPGRTVISGWKGAITGYFNSLRKEWRWLFLLALFILGVIWYFSPALQLATYPGGDDRAYSFIAKQIIDQHTVLASISYPNAYPFLNEVFMAGAMSIVAFFYGLLQTLGLSASIPVLYLFLTMFYFSLTPISLYLLTMGLSKNREFSIIVSLAALFMWRSIFLYFDWGGQEEALGYFLVPIFALVAYNVNQAMIRDRTKTRQFLGTLLIEFVMFAIVMYIHLYSMILFAFLVLIVVPLQMIQDRFLGRQSNLKKKVRFYLKIASPYLIVILGGAVFLVAAVTAIHGFGGMNLLVNGLYQNLISSPQAILSNLPQQIWTEATIAFSNSHNFAYTLSTLGGIMLTYYGDYAQIFIVMFLACIAFLVILRRKNLLSAKERQAVELAEIMALTFVCFFLFTQDSPFGWYFIPYPFEILILAARLYYELNVFTIYVFALPIYLVYVLLKRLTSSPNTSTSRWSNGRLSRHSVRRRDVEILSLTFLIMIIITNSTLQPIASNYNGFSLSRVDSVVNSSDLDAFNWIRANVPSNATFIVNPGDAGAYIYIFTGRIVFPVNSLRLAEEENTSNLLNEIVVTLCDGNISEKLVQLMQDCNISYVYVGSHTQYGIQPFDTESIGKSPCFSAVFSEGGTYIFKVEYAAVQLSNGFAKLRTYRVAIYSN